MRGDDYVKLRWFPDPASAAAARAILEAEGISCVLDPSDPFAATIAAATRGVRLLVRVEHRHRAEQLMTEASEAEAIGTEEEPES